MYVDAIFEVHSKYSDMIDNVHPKIEPFFTNTLYRACQEFIVTNPVTVNNDDKNVKILAEYAMNLPENSGDEVFLKLKTVLNCISEWSDFEKKIRDIMIKRFIDRRRISIGNVQRMIKLTKKSDLNELTNRQISDCKRIMKVKNNYYEFNVILFFKLTVSFHLRKIFYQNKSIHAIAE